MAKIVDREGLKAFRQRFQNALENGQIVPSKSLTTKQIENVGEDVGSTQSAPFIFQATATDNGADIVETAPVAKHLKKLGNTVVVNQLLNHQNFDTTIQLADNCSCSNNNDGSITLTVTSTVTIDGYIALESITPLKGAVSGHTYLISGAKSNYLKLGYGSVAVDTGNNGIASISFSSSISFRVFITAGLTAGTYKLFPQLNNITQWFNGDIPQDLLDHPENAGRYGMLGLAYNTGTLSNGNGRYLQCIRRNAFNKENATLKKIINTSGVETSVSGYFHSDYIKCIPNTNYNFKGAINWDVGGYVVWFDKNKNFITYNSTSGTMPLNVHTKSPANAEYMIMNGVSSAIDSATISLYYEDGTGYSDYYPYEENTYDTGTEVLRSAGSVKDVKLPSNEITRNVGSVDLGTLTYEKTTIDSYVYFSATLSGGKRPNYQGDTQTVYNLLCAKYRTSNQASWTNNVPCIFEQTATTGSCIIIIGFLGSSSEGQMTSAQFKTAMSGVMLYYELDTPTTETGTSFPENIEVDNYGSMGWLDTNNAYVDIPQGSEFFYPADYVEFIDSLYTRSKDGGDSADVNNIVVKSELTAETNARTSQDSILQNAIGGTLRQCLCVKESLDFDNTDFVDLGSLSWSYDDITNHYFSATISNIKPAGSNTNVAKILCTLYKTNSWNNVAPITGGVDMNISVNGTNAQIAVRNSSYTSSTTFKNAMKGVLLAYEKA